MLQSARHLIRRSFATTKLDKVIFTSTCKSNGRVGTVESVGDSGSGLKFELQKHVGHGGEGGTTNPEELFAAGYSACFNGAFQHMAATHEIACGASTTTAAVDFGTDSALGGVGIAVHLTVDVEDCDQATGEKIAALAHDFCPYSKATRGNIEVDVNVQTA
jgi:lipoyl-dependent peroxiredoxin